MKRDLIISLGLLGLAVYFCAVAAWMLANLIAGGGR